MDKNKCNSCGEKKCSCRNKDFTKSVIEIDNPEQITLMRKVTIPASMGDDKTVPPVVGKYHNVLLNYEANNKTYLYSSDGIPTQLNNGVTDYEAAVNLPQINGHTLIGDKTSLALGLQSKFFDTVADMKTANLEAGEYAGTMGFYSKSDGGDAFYSIRAASSGEQPDDMFTFLLDNGLIAELVHDQEINVLKVGANSTNLADIVNSLIYDRYNVYVPKGEYTVNDTITISRSDSQFVCDGNLTTSISLLFYVYSYRNIIKINGKCVGNGGVDSVFMQIAGEGYSSNNSNIYIHYATGFGVGVALKPGGGRGCAYNNIKFDLLGCRKYGILFQTGTGVNFINENYFQGGRIQGYTGMLSGIKTIKGESQADPYNGNVFDHICIDDYYDIAIDLELASYNHFNDFRLSEGTPANYYIKLHDQSFENRFSSKSRVDISKILDENSNWNHFNYFDIRIKKDDYPITNRFKTNMGTVLVEREDFIASSDWAYSVSYTYNNTTYTEPAFYVDGMTTISFGHDTTAEGETFDYVLPRIFWGGGVKTFYMRIQYMSAIDNFTLKTASGALVADRNSVKPSGVINQEWYKVEYVGNIQGNRWKVTPVNG